MADVKVINEKGEMFLLPESQLSAAQSQGYSLASPEQVQKQDRQEFLKESTLAEGVAFLGGAADMVTFGAFDPLLEKYAPDKAALLAEAQEANPVASGFGTAAGIVPSIIGGPAKLVAEGGKGVYRKIVGEVAEEGVKASLKRRALARVAQGAVEGAALSLPAAGAEAFTGDYDEAAETLMLGAGLGGVITPALSMAESLLTTGKRVGPKIADVVKEKADDFPVDMGLKEVGAQKSLLKGMTPEERRELVDFAKEKGFLAGIEDALTNTPSKLLTRMEEEANKVGAAKYQILKDADAVAGPEGFINVNNLVNALEEELGAIKNTNLRRGERAAVSSFLKDVKGLSQETQTVTRPVTRSVPSGVLDANGQPIMKQVTEEVAEQGSKAIPLTFENAEDLRLSLKNKAYTAKAKHKSTELADTYASLERIMDDAIEQGLVAADGAFAGAEAGWSAAKREYRLYKRLEPLLENKFNMSGNQLISLSDMHAGTMAGVAGGGPVSAATGMLLNLARKTYGATVARLMVEEGAKGAGRIANTISSVSDKVLNNRAGRYARDNAATAVKVGSLGVLRSLTGERDREKAVDSMVSHLADISTKPEFAASRSAEILGTLPEEDSQLAMATQEKMVLLAQTLLELAPKKEAVASPFQSDVGKYTDSEISQFEKQVKAAIDPLSVLEDVANETVDPASLEIVQRLYPKVYEKAVTEILEKSTEKRRTYSYGKKLALSMLLNAPVDNLGSPENIRIFQQNFTSPEKQAPKTGRKTTLADDTMSVGQRIESR